MGLLAFGAAVHYVRAEIATGTPPRNYGAGIRTKATMSSERPWQAGHAAAGPRLRLTYLTVYGSGALSLLTSLVLALLDAAHPVVLVVPAARAVPGGGGEP
ncbi:SdpI family protein [Streptomyces albidoflavus]